MMPSCNVDWCHGTRSALKRDNLFFCKVCFERITYQYKPLGSVRLWSGSTNCRASKAFIKGALNRVFILPHILSHHLASHLNPWHANRLIRHKSGSCPRKLWLSVCQLVVADFHHSLYWVWNLSRTFWYPKPIYHVSLTYKALDVSKYFVNFLKFILVRDIYFYYNS